MFLYDRIANGEAKPAAGGFGGKVGIKDLFGERLINAGPFVRDGDLYITPRWRQRACRWLNVNVVGGDRHGPAVWHRLAGIHHQSVNNLLDLPPINFRLPKIAWKIELGAQTRAIKAELNRLLEQF